ncbi:putative LTR transposable element [Pseudoloma neurophilia]|uniref:Putative LTR transposable element n=1 Tax=Pseudoloma neurophilia TaxID=146866 RepID=A0A0R0M3Z7_9MICR|nr:putative LTR transposable element [Pseudoloma neurophilia]
MHLQIFGADMSPLNVIGNAEIDIRTKQPSEIIFKTPMLIIDGLVHDVILGREFLERHEFILNFRDGFIQCPHATFEMASSTSSHQRTVNEANNIVENGFKTNHRLKLRKLLLEHKTRDLHQKIPHIQHTIETVPDKTIYLKPYPVPDKLVQATKKEVQRLLEEKIIIKTKDGWSSPAFAKQKKDGSIRLLIDYRALNEITRQSGYPNPGIDDLLTNLHGMTIFSKIDLKNGYYQIPMAPSDRYKTGFSILGQHYECIRMPMGLKNAPKTFQHAMMNIFGDFEFVKVYLDDLLIHSLSESEHERHLEMVFKRISDNNILINVEKSKFYQDEIDFLGKTINKHGIKLNTSELKMEHLDKVPLTKRQLQSLIGFINWCRPHLPGLSSKIAPLNEKLKDPKIRWTDHDRSLINEIRTDIQKNQNLAFPDPNKNFELFTDASEKGIGAVLKQESNIIGIFSKKLSGSELNYSVVEKEFFAIYKALLHFRKTILCSKITIWTDNRNCTFDCKNPVNRINRWKHQLEEFDYKILHIEGKQNTAADHLSRHEITNTISEINPFETKTLSTTYQAFIDTKNGSKLINIPNNKSRAFVVAAHEYLGHPGADKLARTLNPLYQIRELAHICHEVSKECCKCQRAKSGPTHYGKTSGHLSSKTPFTDISVDIVGPFNPLLYNTNLTNHFHLLVVTDMHSRFTKVGILKTLTSNETWSVLKKTWLDLYTKPERIHSDNGTQFTAEKFQKQLQDLKIVQTFSSVNNPQSNGITERSNRAINEIFRIYKNHDLETIITKIHRRLNETIHRTTNCLPTEINFSHNPISPKAKSHYDENEVNRRIKEESIKNEQKTNKKRKTIEFNDNDLLYIKCPTGIKTDNKFDGPYRMITQSKDKNRLLVSNGMVTKWTNTKNVKVAGGFHGRGQNVTTVVYSCDMKGDIENKNFSIVTPNNEQ